MAAARAETIAATIHPSRASVTAVCCAAKSTPVRAKGSANTEWLNRTNEPYARMRPSMVMAYASGRSPIHCTRDASTPRTRYSSTSSTLSGMATAISSPRLPSSIVPYWSANPNARAP